MSRAYQSAGGVIAKAAGRLPVDHEGRLGGVAFGRGGR
jgi:hypothetical protein